MVLPSANNIGRQRLSDGEFKKYELEAKEKLVSVTDYMNIAFKQAGLPLFIDNTEALKQLGDRKYENVLMDKLYALKRIHRTHIWSFVNLLINITYQVPDSVAKKAKENCVLPRVTPKMKRTTPYLHHVFNSTTQTGKNGTIQITQLSAPCCISLLFDGALSVFHTTLTAAVSHERQYDKLHSGLKYVFLGLTFKNTETKKTCSFKEITSELSCRGITPQYRSRITNSNKSEQISAYVKSALDAGVYVFICDDESDYGTAKKGQKDKIEQAIGEHEYLGFIYFSGTQFEQLAIASTQDRLLSETELPLNIKKCIWTHAWLDYGYVGFNVVAGYELNTFREYVNMSLNVSNYDDFGIPEDFFPRAYRDKDVYMKSDKIDLQKAERTGLSWHEWKKHSMKGLVSLIYLTLFDKKYRDNAKREHNGLVMRFGPAIDDADYMIIQIRNEFYAKHPDKTVKFLSLNCKEDDGTTVEDFLSQNVEPGDKFVLIIVSRGRRGDVFPPICSNFISFGETGNLTTFLQDLPGRATGYHKYSRVYMTSREEAVYHEVQKRLGISESKRLGERCGKLRSGMRSFVVVHLAALKAAKGPEAEKIINAFTEITKLLKERGKKRLAGNNDMNCAVWNLLQKHKIIDAIENISDVLTKDIDADGNIKSYKFVEQPKFLRPHPELTSLKSKKRIIDAMKKEGTIWNKLRFSYDPTDIAKNYLHIVKDEFGQIIVDRSAPYSPLVRLRNDSFFEYGRKPNHEDFRGYKISKKAENAGAWESYDESVDRTELGCKTIQAFFNESGECVAMKFSLIHPTALDTGGISALQLLRTHKDNDKLRMPEQIA